MAVEFVRLARARRTAGASRPASSRCCRRPKTKAKEEGLWNFFLPDAETGEGLKNLDYAYIAAELGKNPLASETMNCSAPDTGNMEVLERVGTKEQKEKWLKPLLERRNPLGLRHDRAERRLVRRQEHLDHGKTRRRRVGDQRREILHLRRRRSALQDHDRDGEDQSRRAAEQAAVANPGAEGHARRRRSSARCMCSAHDHAPRGHMHMRFNNVPRAEGEHPARRRPRFRDLTGAPRTGPHPSLHAHDRQGGEGARPDGHARSDARSLRQADRPSRRQHADHRAGALSRSRRCG